MRRWLAGALLALGIASVASGQAARTTARGPLNPLQEGFVDANGVLLYYKAVGHGPSLRVENRVAGADVNPYLALAAMVAAGLHGIDAELALEPAYEGNAYVSDKPRVPSTLREARDLFAASAIAREAFGQDVVDHYLNMADVELAAFDATVTDWERYRSFERM